MFCTMIASTDKDVIKVTAFKLHSMGRGGPHFALTDKGKLVWGVGVVQGIRGEGDGVGGGNVFITLI